jgi:hypothetical protein
MFNLNNFIFIFLIFIIHKSNSNHFQNDDDINNDKTCLNLLGLSQSFCNNNNGNLFNLKLKDNNNNNNNNNNNEKL